MEYILQERRWDDDKMPHSVEIMIYRHEGDLDKGVDGAALHAILDWRRGLTIFHSEMIEPIDWPEIGAMLTTAMIEAHSRIDPELSHNLDMPPATS